MLAVVRATFGDELLFFCYSFMKELKNRPKSFLELFEFMRYNTAIGILNAMALESIKARAE